MADAIFHDVPADPGRRDAVPRGVLGDPGIQNALRQDDTVVRGIPNAFWRLVVGHPPAPSVSAAPGGASTTGCSAARAAARRDLLPDRVRVAAVERQLGG